MSWIFLLHDIHSPTINIRPPDDHFNNWETCAYAVQNFINQTGTGALSKHVFKVNLNINLKFR